MISDQKLQIAFLSDPAFFTNQFIFSDRHDQEDGWTVLVNCVALTEMFDEEDRHHGYSMGTFSTYSDDLDVKIKTSCISTVLTLSEELNENYWELVNKVKAKKVATKPSNPSPSSKIVSLSSRR